MVDENNGDNFDEKKKKNFNNNFKQNKMNFLKEKRKVGKSLSIENIEKSLKRKFEDSNGENIKKITSKGKKGNKRIKNIFKNNDVYCKEMDSISRSISKKFLIFYNFD